MRHRAIISRCNPSTTCQIQRTHKDHNTREMGRVAIAAVVGSQYACSTCSVACLCWRASLLSFPF